MFTIMGSCFPQYTCTGHPFKPVTPEDWALPCRKSAAQRTLAAWIRENLLALGPTFIKLGQLFSTRSDLFPAEFTEACLCTEHLCLIADNNCTFAQQTWAACLAGAVTAAGPGACVRACQGHSHRREGAGRTIICLFQLVRPRPHCSSQPGPGDRHWGPALVQRRCFTIVAAVQTTLLATVVLRDLSANHARFCSHGRQTLQRLAVVSASSLPDRYVPPSASTVTGSASRVCSTEPPNACFSQVHRATLLSGEQVVVKVQRPGLKRLFDIDLANLRVLARQLDAQEEGRDFTGIYDECADILMQEIDYIAEGRNANRCARAKRAQPDTRH